MRMIYAVIATFCLTCLPAQDVHANNYTIHLVFESSFDDLFEPDVVEDNPWVNVDRDSVKRVIIERVTEDFDPFDIGVSTTSGDMRIYLTGHRVRQGQWIW